MLHTIRVERVNLKDIEEKNIIRSLIHKNKETATNFRLKHILMKKGSEYKPYS